MRESHSDRVALLLASPRVVACPPSRDVAWPVAHPLPPDLAALYARCDGLTLDDGFSLLGKGEIADVTQWLVLEKSLGWADDIVVVGTCRDVVVALDLDVGGRRAGGGVVEAPSDNLEVFLRAASTVLGYLLCATRTGEDESPPPEVTARAAAARGDPVELERELERPMYPGAGWLFARLALELGKLWARVGEEERALSAFARSVEARAAMVGSAGRGRERAAAWRAAAHEARSCGAAAIAAVCETRGAG
jgi:hypothetical protein